MEQVSKNRNGLIIVAMVTALLQCGTTSAQEMKAFLTLKTAKAMADAADKKATAMCIVLDGFDEIVEIVATCLNDHLARLGRTGKVAHGIVDVEHEGGRERSDLLDAGIRASGFVQRRRDPHHQRCNHGRDRRR